MAGSKPSSEGPISDPVGPFRVLDTATRRRAGMVYLAVGLLAAVLILVADVEAMWLTAVAPLVLLAAFQFAGGWKIKVTDMEAITIASKHASFDVGHGSATLGFRGWLAKPVWQVLVFASGPAPDHQALITVDGLSGDILGSYEEEVPTP
ncbi:MAG: hypothetical protein DWP92_03255 [Armatimonadetes bacterium]|nr:MAG: hypothetical protein DWP92_03255 [Armatimonadota bacterium]